MSTDDLYEQATETGTLADVLDAVEVFVRRFVFLTESQIVAIVLWVAVTYVVKAFEVVPYLNVHSPEKRSGKTLLLEVLAELVHKPMLAADMTPAVLFRVMDTKRPTVLFDEVDVIFNGKSERADELRGLLNAGYKKGGAAWRMEMRGTSGEPRSFNVFGPKALAGIGRLPDTISDRSLPIEMPRKLRSHAVERFRIRGKKAETQPLRDQLATWAEVAVEELPRAYPSLPDELNDRAQDIWEPMLAIADAAGEQWGKRARAAARELHGAVDEGESSNGTLALRHIREAFDETESATSLSTSSILDALVDNPEGPWARWWSIDTDHGRRAAASGLAKLLRPYGIKSTALKLGTQTLRGYTRDAFDDAWSRYLGGSDATHATHATPQVGATSPVASVASVASHRQEEAR